MRDESYCTEGNQADKHTYTSDWANPIQTAILVQTSFLIPLRVLNNHFFNASDIQLD